MTRGKVRAMNMRWCPRLVIVALGVWATSVAVGQVPPPPAPSPSHVPPATQPVANVKLEVDPPDFKFGEIWQGAVAKREFTLKNVGPAAVSLSAKSTCGCTVPTQPKSPLAPGESCQIEVSYDTRRTGEAHKKVMLYVAGTQQVAAEIPVEGKVNAIYAITPSDRVMFEGLEADSSASKTLKLENKYGKPLALKMQPDQNWGVFNAELKEIKPEMEYELTVTTRPPLQKGFNRTMITLEPALPEVANIQINVSANIQPRVITTPMKLLVPLAAASPTQQIVRVQYQVAKPIKILGVKSDLGPVQWELLPSAPPSAEAKIAAYQLRVTLPVAESIPAGGTRLLIETDDASPEFKELAIPIMLAGAPPRGPATQPARPAPLPPPAQQPAQAQ